MSQLKKVKMWHEARRQEKKIRGIMVDYKRRADRRREFYEKIKQDPAQFLRMYGRPVKIHLDPAVAMAAEGPQSMMPWQGDTSNMIDRFDVRANLDIIPEYTPDRHGRNVDPNEDEERLANYERYRTLVENEAAGLSEEHCLHQIYLDEHFGTINRNNEEEKKKNSDKKAAIGFVYEDSTQVDKDGDESEEEESDDDLETADLDVTIDVDALTPDQTREINLCAAQYGMKDDDFSRLLRKDKEELEALREAKQLEEAKAQFSGRKSRRERRAINEKRQNPQRFSRPSYAARESPKYEPYRRPGSSSRSRSRSRSRSSEVAPVTFITSFGADSDNEGVVQGPTLPATRKAAAPKKTSSPEPPSKCENSWQSQRSSSRNKSRSRSKRSSSRSRSRSRSRGRRRSSSSRSSRSWSRSRSRSMSRSRSRSGARQSSSYRKNSNGRSSTSKSRRRRSRSYSSSSRSRSRSRSRSPINRASKRSESPPKKPVIKRYRRESLSSNSELSGVDSDDDNRKSTTTSQPFKMKTPPRTETSSKTDSSKSGKISSKPLPFQSSSSRETPQERLKRRMQAQLNRQYKADKKAEITKISKQEQERMDREEEIRTLALEMRRREREKRHKEREEEEKERRARRRSRHTSDSSNSSKSGSRSNSSKSNSSSPAPSRSPKKIPEKKREEKAKPDSKRNERRDESRKDDRRREPPPLSSLEDRRRLDRDDERRWEGRRDSSRWDGDGGRGRPERGPRSGRDSDSMRWDGPRSGQRWEARGYDRNWGSDQRGWESNPRDWGDGHWQNRPPPSHYSGRSRQPLLRRPSSPLMSRPRPPNDPTLMDEPMDFD